MKKPPSLVKNCESFLAKNPLGAVSGHFFFECIDRKKGAEKTTGSANARNSKCHQAYLVIFAFISFFPCNRIKAKAFFFSKGG